MPDIPKDKLREEYQMRFEDLEQRRFSATQTLRFAPIARPADSIRLDAVGLRIQEVTAGGAPVEHYQDDGSLTLRFDPALPEGCLDLGDTRFHDREPPGSPIHSALLTECGTQAQGRND